MILKFIWEGKKPKIASKILKKKNKAGGFTQTDSKSFYTVTVLKTACIGERRDTEINGIE